MFATPVSLMRIRSRIATTTAFLGLLAMPVVSLALTPDFVTFESDQVRPLAISPDQTRLFAVNTPDGRLEIFDITPAGLVHSGSTAVGLEPVAVAARSASEVWVVNHLSDSLSIVDVSTTPPRVRRTLLLCDEPRDIVFGGPDKTRTFVTSARRGQNCPVPALTTTPGVGRALVTVYDATALGSGLGGSPITTLELFSDKPRALAVSQDGSTVYAAAFHSGNQTTSIHELAVCDGGADAPPCAFNGVTFPGGLPEPNENFQGIPQPEEGLIVRYDSTLGIWKDELGRSWNDYVRFDLPDKDVFAIDATANPPAVTQTFSGVGTILYSMAVHPVSGKVFVSNTEARNEMRFAHPALFGTSVLRGHQHESRITVLDGSSVLPRHLNKHIDYDAIPAPAGTRQKSLATPLGMALSSGGEVLYLVALGSDKVGVLQTAALEDDSFVPDAANHISVSGGPTGLVLDEDNNRLYVFTRFDNSVAVVDLAAAQEVSRHSLHNPEPKLVVEGRPFLYDATATSSNGEASCASCHVFGDLDSLAWDLGSPLEPVVPNPNPSDPMQPPPDFHPQKGPMVTMSLRGMANHGPLHLRGDRTGLFDSPPTDAMNVRSSFRTFNVAFAALLGRDEGPIPEADMSSFAAFAERLTYPPNPIRSLDNSLNSSEQRGRTLYHSKIVFVPLPKQRACHGCHLVEPAAGAFGTDGLITPGVNDHYKTPHFRNLYQRVGMFGMVVVPIVVPTIGGSLPLFEAGDNDHMGDQVRGFGFEHAGAVDTLFRFNRYFLFAYTGTPAQRDPQRRDLEAYMLALETDLAPIVGQQVTLDQSNGAHAAPRIALLMERAEAIYPSIHDAAAPECDLVVKGTVAGEARGWLYRDGRFYSDRVGVSLTSAELQALASVPGQELTYSCVAPGSGTRIGIDRDADGILDGDETALGMDPARAERIPGGGPRGSDCVSAFTVYDPSNQPMRDRRGDLNKAQRCRDGDALCDADGVANGSCEFLVRVCFNSETAQCSSAGLRTWQMRSPSLDGPSGQDAENAARLRDAVLALDFAAAVGTDPRSIQFPNAVSAADSCTELVDLSVPLLGKARIVTSSTDAAGLKDADRLRLLCLPSAS